MGVMTSAAMATPQPLGREGLCVVKGELDVIEILQTTTALPNTLTQTGSVVFLYVSKSLTLLSTPQQQCCHCLKKNNYRLKLPSPFSSSSFECVFTRSPNSSLKKFPSPISPELFPHDTAVTNQGKNKLHALLYLKKKKNAVQSFVFSTFFMGVGQAES